MSSVGNGSLTVDCCIAAKLSCKVDVVFLENQCDVTEENSLSTLNLLWAFARSESYIKNGIEVYLK